MTITLNKELEQAVRRRAAEAGYEDVQTYVNDRLAGDVQRPTPTREMDEREVESEAERRRRISASIDRMVGTWKSDLTYEDIAAETRSEVY